MNAADGSVAGSVVLGFEGGWQMTNLLELAAREAAVRETTLAIVTVAHPAPDPRRSFEGQKADGKRAALIGRDHLARAAKAVQDRYPNLAVTTHYLSEEDAESAHAPLSPSPQLLVVGAVGRYGRQAFGLESISRVLLKATGCPVLVVPEENSIGARKHDQRTVVAGVGEICSDSDVIQAAWAESVRLNCDLQIVHTYQDRLSETPAEGLRRAAEVTAQAIASAGVALRPGGSVLLTQETPVTALSRQSSDATLLVIGSRPGSLSGLVLGSVGKELLGELPCPMLVIPSKVVRPGSWKRSPTVVDVRDSAEPDLRAQVPTPATK